MIASLSFLLLLIPFVAIGFLWAAVQDWKQFSSMPPSPSSKSSVIKTVYFYVVSLVALFMIVFSLVDLVNLGLKTWVFPKADQQEWRTPPCAAQIYDGSVSEAERDRSIKQCEASQISEEEARAIRAQRDAVRDISMLVVALPLFAYHWRIVRKEKDSN